MGLEEQTPLTAEPVNDFASDAIRRIVANLSQPRTVASLVRELDADHAVAIGIAHLDEVAEVLPKLEKIGLVKNLGDLQTADELVGACQDDEDAIDLHEDKAEILQRRAEARPARYLDTGDNWILTKAGLAKLQGPVPNEPPPVKAEEE